MKILEYKSAFKTSCINIFESNRPKFFAEGELELFEKYLDQVTDGYYFVVKEENQIIACGGIFFDKSTDSGGLSWGMVHKKYHGKGIGLSFSNYRIKELQRKFPNKSYIIETSQHTAKFYEKIGFKLNNIVPNGFGDGIDKYTMYYSN
ncbi:GNAT family N-acetyltransferase [Flavobacterium aquidurense]|uniref:GNAT family N-acyltransferase n=2 Tax=Flavobacterium TaxID=237 RepID=A0ABR6QBU0_9FLAO|nr:MULTISPECIES: GNAT family N-acetyltransferase [Flavobacterium]MBB4801735.1 putative GNAT family N-acyltransferase [Flavobacterium nitrogenifigens]MBB6386693.1 putative GNAT family N-acyltransferase [Flavobacterium notoginsengisoli]